MRRLAVTIAIAGSTVVASCSEPGGGPTSNAEAARPSFASAQDTTGGASHYTANGRLASVNWSSGGFDSTTGGGSTDFGTLFAQDVNDVRNEVVLVSYQVGHCDAFGCITTEGGFGTVPKGALTGTDHRMTLEVTPSASPETFFVYAGSGGPIHVSWQADGVSTYSVTGNTETTGPGFRFRSNGSSTTASAGAAGAISSAAIPAGAQGSIGTNHNVTLLFQH